VVTLPRPRLADLPGHVGAWDTNRRLGVLEVRGVQGSGREPEPPRSGAGRSGGCVQSIL
jgi:hypothetical protein